MKFLMRASPCTQSLRIKLNSILPRWDSISSWWKESSWSTTLTYNHSRARSWCRRCTSNLGMSSRPTRRRIRYLFWTNYPIHWSFNNPSNYRIGVWHHHDNKYHRNSKSSNYNHNSLSYPNSKYNKNHCPNRLSNSHRGQWKNTPDYIFNN